MYITYNHSHFQRLHVHTCVHRPSVETGNSGCLRGVDPAGCVLSNLVLPTHSFYTFWIVYRLFKKQNKTTTLHLARLSGRSWDDWEHGPWDSRLENVSKQLLAKAHPSHKKNILVKQPQDTCLCDIASWCALPQDTLAAHMPPGRWWSWLAS